MAATWRLIFFPTSFFFIIPSKPGIYIGFRGLRVYWHRPFSYATENEAMAAIFILNLIISC